MFFNRSEARDITETDNALARFEPYWVHTLSRLSYADIHFRSSCPAFGRSVDFEVERLIFPNEYLDILNNLMPEPRMAVAAIFSIFIGRYCGRSNFSLGYSNSQLLDDGSRFGGLFSQYVPLCVSFNPKESLSEGIASLSKDIEGIDSFKTFQKEIWCRYPQLRRHTTNDGPPDSPVNLVFTEDIEKYRAPGSSVINFLISENLGSCFLVYNPACISREETLSLKTLFFRLLQELATGGHGEIRKISVLSDRDRKKVFEVFNDTAAHLPPERCVHRLFEEQARKSPEAAAILYDDDVLTYETLNTCSNRLANQLEESGIKKESLVGVYMNQTPDMVVALLAVLKAGGAYVPLDCSFPEDRISYMIQDSGCRLILTEQRLRDSLAVVGGKNKIIVVDSKWDKISGNRPDADRGVLPSDLAYVIYTSGSTGKPKGVMIEHRNVANFFAGMDRCLKYDPDSVQECTWLATTTISFDLSVLEIFWTLCRGFRVVLGVAKGIHHPSHDTERNDSNPSVSGRKALSIPEVINRHKVTHFQCTPSMAGMLTWDEDAKHAFGGLKKLLIGGEPFPASLAATLKGAVKGDILNMYGPTETTVYSTSHEIVDPATGVPIGRPLTNTRVYILDESLQPLPVGETGELVIGGDGVARGYLNRPELTSERFIDDPFSEKKEHRLYRTGDLGRYRHDGTVEFLGRKDNQIKILGYRIEPGEIEAVINEFPSVIDTVVIAHEDDNGQKQLIAYIIPSEVTGFDIKTLRDFTEKALPAYMVPTHFIEVKTFPKTLNEKIDRNAFPPPDKIRSEHESAISEPRKELARALAEIWASVLDVPCVHMKDNFFDLGGDTATANQMLKFIGETCDVALPIGALYESPTLDTFILILEKAFIQQAESGYTVQVLPDIEGKIVRIWSDVLGVEHIDPGDNFFDLGGTSLLGVQIAFKIQIEFGIILPLSSFFKAPTIRELSGIVATELGDKKAYGQADGDIASRPIVFEGTKTNFPLSNVQIRFWVLQALDPNQPVYNISVAFRISGLLDVETLIDSLNIIVERHDILRTTFPAETEVPEQKSNAFIPLRIPVRDLTTSQNVASKQDIGRLLENEARKPFALDADSFLRIGLYKTGTTEHILSITSHHLVLDGWSIRILTQELGELYRAGIQNREHILPDLPIRYGDYAVWEQEFTASENMSEHSAYWTNKLEGASFVLDLPTDFKRPPVETFDGETIPIEVSKALTQKLRKFSQSQGATIFMTLLAAFQTLLHRYSGQQDILVGTAVSNINRSEIQNLLGSFSNNIVLRAVFDDDITFSELLQQVKHTVLEAHEYQDFPFEKLLEDIQPERDLSRNPLFQAAFIFHQSILEKNLQFDDLRFESIPVDLGSSRFDITLELDDSIEGIVGFFEFKKDLFRRETIYRMAGHLMMILDAVVMNADMPVSRINILSREEKTYLIDKLNRTQKPYPKHFSLHQLFMAQALETSERVAAVSGKTRINYKSLDERSNKLAHFLRGEGVESNTIVGLCTDRSLDMLVSVLGILKAGGAYLPLDPDYPAERLHYMLADSGASVVVTQTMLKSLLPARENVRVLCIDEEKASIENQSDTPPEMKHHPEDPAYIVYTSGSTGRPKGVQVPHRAVVNFLTSMRQAPGFDSEDVLTAVTTLSFDIHVLELFLPLLAGGRVVIADNETTSDGDRLLRFLNESETTVMQATPGTLRLLLAAGWEGSPNLKVLCGGEAFPSDLVRELRPRVGSLWNMYGPTETTVWSICHQIEDDRQPIFIGRPIANTRIYVLDHLMQPVPVGIAGELYIGGDGLSSGYLNHAGLTEKMFVPDPFRPETETLVYKTGDFVRYHADGNLEYLGRFDTQVKIRGFRIELGEIESVLLDHPLVDQCAAIVREDRPGDVRLVGYIVTKSGKEVDVEDLRTHLRFKLPEYMIPQLFVKLESLPLTPAGKIDRNNLSTPLDQGAMAPSAVIPPRNNTEKLLADTWRELIGVDLIGIHDSFFDIGGNSIMAIQLMSRINQVFQIPLPLRQLFDTPTIADFSLVIEKNLLNEISPLSEQEAEKLLKENS